MKYQIGDTYELLTVVAECHRGRHGHAQLWCRCACGKELVIRESFWGKTKSCGCQRAEVMRQNRKKRHYSRTPA